LDESRIYYPGEFEGFYKWAQRLDYPMGATHPIEPAHTDFALKILPFVEPFAK
jgi:hypothetical protein